MPYSSNYYYYLPLYFSYRLHSRFRLPPILFKPSPGCFGEIEAPPMLRYASNHSASTLLLNRLLPLGSVVAVVVLAAPIFSFLLPRGVRGVLPPVKKT